MATNQLDYQNFFSTVLSTTITATDTTLYLNTLPTPSEGYLVIEPDSDTNKEIIYYTSKGANYVTCPDVATGRGVGGTTATSHSSGATVQRNVVAEDLREVQNGNSNTGLHQYFDESFADYVLSGGSITQATGLIASISSGVAYINGRRLPFNAMSKTLTASKDTYIDLVETDGSNIATVSYTELASGATGSAPVSNGLHIGMVQTHTASITRTVQSGIDVLGNPLKQSNPVFALGNYSKNVNFIPRSVANSGTAGGTTYLLDIGGVKIAWLIGAVVSNSPGQNLWTWVIPSSFFSQVPSITNTPTTPTSTGDQVGIVITPSATSITLGVISNGSSTCILHAQAIGI